MPKAYSSAQVWLHWLVAVLILAQFLDNDAIGGAWRAFRRGQEMTTSSLVWAHVVAGVAVLALAAWRLGIRSAAAPRRRPRANPRRSAFSPA